MKITAFRSQALNVPEDEPLAGAVEKQGGTRPIVILTLGLALAIPERAGAAAILADLGHEVRSMVLLRLVRVVRKHDVLVERVGDRTRKLREVWQRVWTDRVEQPLGELLVSLEAAVDDASEELEVPGRAEKGYPKLKIEVEIQIQPSGVKRPLELVQALTWNIEILERARETMVLECRRRHYSWADLASALNVARQSAWTKYASLESDAEIDAVP